MYQYTAFGLCIHSDIELSGFASADGTPDVTIRQHALRLQPDPRPAVRGEVVSGRILEEAWDLDLLFYIQNGENVFYRSLEPIEPRMLRSFVQGALLAGVLRQRGLLVLHGSAVSDGERAIAFLGNSGWGKSTLAAYFCQHGYQLITDDVMVVIPGTEAAPAVVPPGVKQVRLRPRAAQHLVGDFEALPFVTEITQKRVHILDGEDERSLPLAKLYLLERQTAEDNRIVPLAPREAAIHLIAHTHSTNWITAPTFVSRHLIQCAQLSQHTPVSRLERRFTLDALPAIFDLVQADLGRADGKAPMTTEHR